MGILGDDYSFWRHLKHRIKIFFLGSICWRCSKRTWIWQKRELGYALEQPNNPEYDHVNCPKEGDDSV